MDTTRSRTPSTVSRWTCRKVVVRSGSKRPQRSVRSRQPCWLFGASPPVASSMHSPSRRTHGTDSSRMFQASATRPPGRSTRWISDRARMVSNQWNACATTTASTDPAGSGTASAAPSSSSASGTTVASTARMPATGSSARILAPDGASWRVILPVPAPSSRRTRPGRRSSRSTMDGDGLRRVVRAAALIRVGGRVEAARGDGVDGIGHARTLAEVRPGLRPAVGPGRVRG